MRKSIALVFLFSYLFISSHAQLSRISGFSSNAAQAQLTAEKKFDAALSPENIDTYLKTLSAFPHNVGTAQDATNAQYILDKFKSWGYDAHIETFYVLYPTPKIRLLEMTGSRYFKAALSENALKEDASTGQKNQLPTYNAYSPDGDVTAELVFVNYGVPADYERLARLGIDVKGKIVIAKYGQSWRGIKPKVAQEHGAIGCIIYSDPRNDGYYQGDVYPIGAARPGSGVQRGSVEDMPIYPGDPLTPGVGATKEAKRLTKEEATNLLKIPVLPISYDDALPLLQSLMGPVAPEDWRGALPITYHVGPSVNKVHLKLAFNWDMKPVNDIIAKMPGSVFPDEWVMRGNHHDAWVNGAADPLSGQSAMLEEARAISELAKTGWKPKRTIVYCAWDGEEPGLLGSTEYVETHADELQKKLVLYINSDNTGRGFLGASGSHALENAFTEIAKDVTDPKTGVSVFERKKMFDIVNAATTKAKNELLAKKTFTLGALGSGSDYSPFFQHIGIPSLDIGFGGEDNGGEYHSIYDTYDMFKRFKDPAMAYGITLAKTAGRATLRFADAEILPFDFSSLQKTIAKYATEVIALNTDMREATELENKLIKENAYQIADNVTYPLLPPAMKADVPYLNFSALQNALSDAEKNADSLNRYIASGTLTDAQKNALNIKLYQAEQQLLTRDGLPRRGWYRHTIYAPGFYTGYGVKTLPGIREAIEQRNWTEAQEQIAVTAGAIARFAAYLAAAAR